ncbi:MAG TPA: ATP-binding protein [Granulicella sp.]|jgi:signal transduction histidine kinase|nr:ATP-binding protein [Granulicella sp.]
MSSTVVSNAPAEPYRIPSAPPVPTPVPEIVEALRTIGPLEGLSDPEYEWIARHGTERTGDNGAIIFREGEPVFNLTFILKGEIHVRRRHVGPMAIFIGRAGQMTGKLPFSRMKGYGGDGYTSGPIWVLDLHEGHFPEMLQAIPSMGQRCVTVLLDRVREVTRMEQQAEKLTALGKLAANLAHELNNPASAAQRSAAGLFSELRDYGNHKYRLGSLCLTAEESSGYMTWIERARREMGSHTYDQRPDEIPLAVADREDAVMRWLEAHQIPEPWKIAPALAEVRLGLSTLDDLAAVLAPKTLPVALATVASSLRAERMAETVVDSTVRIFDLISAIKDYSYMDQAPIQEVDLAESLEKTLLMFQSRLQNITVKRDFEPGLNHINAYGGELNQVWTVLIENALDAIDAGRRPGTVQLKTRISGQVALVEIWDNGPGIEPGLQSRIFEPFFTTKAPGHGLGLGLDTAQRIVSKHSGYITVQSKPGETCFQVRLPLNQGQAY